MSNRSLGAEKEELAAQWMQKHGCKILDRNYQIASGEIDLIVRDGIYLVFVEVKYRSTDRAGTGAEAVGYRKQQRIYRTAQHYMKKNKISQLQPCRFDVISIDGSGKIEWIQNAFGGM